MYLSKVADFSQPHAPMFGASSGGGTSVERDESGQMYSVCVMLRFKMEFHIKSWEED